MNAARLVFDSIEKYGNYTAYQFADRVWSSTEHFDYASRIAAVLRDRGVGPGDRVPVIMPNCPEVLACFQAVWRLGAVIVPTTPQLGQRELAYVLNHADAKLALTSPVLAGKVDAAAAEAPECEVVYTVGPAAAEGARDIEAADPIDGFADRADDDLAMLLYTSGTTGHPKGVMLSHQNLVSNHRAVAEFGRLKERSQTILVLPLSHSFGVLMMNLCNILGVSAAVQSKFDPKEVVSAIAEFRVTRFSVVPTMLVKLNQFDGLNGYDVSSLEVVNSGGSILPNEVRLEFEERYGCKVLNGYGLSECAPTATSFPASEIGRPGSIGRPIPGVTVSIQNEDGAELLAGEPGEICIQGPNVMQGYWKNEDATREALRGGRLHSGDIGYRDADGYVYLTDRIKDLIIKGGENISPREIEDALYEHDAVAETVVIGVPDPTYGETIVAVVSLKPGQRATEDSLAEHLANHVTKFKLPSRYVFLDALPRNPNGKFDRKRLRAELSAVG